MLLVHLHRAGCRILLGDPGADAHRLRWRAYLPRDRVEAETLSILYFTLLGAAESRSLPAPGLDWREIGAEDWPERMRSQLQPVLPVGRRLLLVPANQDPPDDAAERIVIRLRATGAFGTGRHPTTRLALKGLEALFAADALSTTSGVVELGCGSGVLSLAAARLGARTVHAVDKDPLAVETALANRRLNEIPEERLTIEIGSVEVLRRVSAGASDALLCNLRWPALEPLLPQTVRLVRPGAAGVFSGFRKEESSTLRRAFSAQGWVWERTLEEGEWIGVIARRGGTTSGSSPRLERGTIASRTSRLISASVCRDPPVIGSRLPSRVGRNRCLQEDAPPATRHAIRRSIASPRASRDRGPAGSGGRRPRAGSRARSTDPAPRSVRSRPGACWRRAPSPGGW